MDTWDVYKKAMIVFSKIVKSRLNVSEHDFLNGYVLAKESCDGILKKTEVLQHPQYTHSAIHGVLRTYFAKTTLQKLLIKN